MHNEDRQADGRIIAHRHRVGGVRYRIKDDFDAVELGSRRGSREHEVVVHAGRRDGCRPANRRVNPKGNRVGDLPGRFRAVESDGVVALRHAGVRRQIV